MKMGGTKAMGASLLLLAACGGGETPQPAALTRDEEQALQDAAAMLDEANNEQSLPSGAIQQPQKKPVVRQLPRAASTPP